MPFAARVIDMHVCPMVSGLAPHVGGPILPPCCPTVMAGFLPNARVADMAVCVGPPDIIAQGSSTVMIGNMPDARLGDATVHGGVIVVDSHYRRLAMVIRNETVDLLSTNHYLEFENRTAAWLERDFPEDCRLLGANKTRVRIREAVQVAARYGYVSQRDAMRFAYLWFLMGPHFDVNPGNAWLRDILCRPSEDPSAQMDKAFDAIATRFEGEALEATV